MNFYNILKFKSINDLSSKSRNIALAAAGIVIAVLLFDLCFPPPDLRPFSQQVLSADGNLMSAYLTNDDKWRLRTSIDEVSPQLLDAIINKEDKYFYYHFGVNPVSLFRAFFSNILKGEIVSGASTITMQTIRMLEPRARNYSSKFIEILRAAQFELHYSKKEILEIYLSLLPYGGNIEGVRSASFIYFNKPPGQLSLAQSILLAVIPNDPNNLRPDLYSSEAKANRDKYIKIFEDEEIFPIEELEDAIEEPVRAARHSIPNTAPHFSRRVKNNYQNDIIHTYLKEGIQFKAEKLLKNYINRVKGKFISNGAVLIIDNKNNSVAGYCGSADYQDDQSSGQVDGIIAVRSPGSTLKPFLYTYAFDSGILTPRQRLLDIPTDFHGYEPENYDLKFRGMVTAEFALLNSLNIPAVALLEKIHFSNFINLLIKSGFGTIESQKSLLGLSTILGGCGVTLEELTSAYSAISHGGKYQNLIYSLDDLPSSPRNLFSEEAAYLTLDILSKNERPDYPAAMAETTKLPKIAWKTGTSYGKRDAWSIGISPNYTIGVWVGNFNGEGSPYLSGAEIAVPLLFELFNSIDYDPDKKWFDMPEGVGVREVCMESGLIPANSCKSKTKDFYIKGVSNTKICDLEKEIYVSKDEKIQYCTECLPKTEYKRKTYINYPDELRKWMSENRVEFDSPPPHNSECNTRAHTGKLKITSPAAGFQYFIEEGSDEKISLSAVTSQDAEKLFWYVNDTFFKSSKVNEKLFFLPKIEKTKISCIDDKGRNDQITIFVKFY